MPKIITICVLLFVAFSLYVSFATRNISNCVPNEPLKLQDFPKEEYCVASKKEYLDTDSCLNKLKQNGIIYQALIKREYSHMVNIKNNHNNYCVDFSSTLIS